MNRFTRVKLKNWRNFKTVDVALADRVFVVGANATGKSNFLDVFRFLHELARDGGGLTNALQGSNRGGFKKIRSLHASRNQAMRIEVECDLDGTTWGYALELEEQGSTRVAKEEVWRKGRKLLARPNSQDKGDVELLSDTALEHNAANKEFRALRDFFRSVDYIHVVPQLIRNPASDDAARFGKGLGATLIRRIQECPNNPRKKRLRAIAKALKSVLPQFTELDFYVGDGGLPHLRARYEHWRKNGGWQDEDTFSDGTLRLIGFLWFFLEGDGPLLLEEPELSLQTEIVRRIPGILARLNVDSGRQVLLTTHSPELLSDAGIDLSEILILDGRKGATVVLEAQKDAPMVAAAKADVALGRIAIDRARAPRVDQLSLDLP
ncbi:MAG: AAA family ATPase [Polyangiaceae bacterium]|nr:AAA family ATPase [Polyangiaceae bacterium]